MDSYEKLKQFHEVSVITITAGNVAKTKPPSHLLYGSFIQQHHHCNVSKKENPSLYKWVARQRGERSQYLNADRRALLDAIQFEWNGTRGVGCEVQWEINFSKLKVYLKNGGSFKISAIEDYDRTLSIWVANQRKRNNRDMMRDDRKKKLSSIGFVFGEPRRSRPQKVGMANEQKWELMFQRLVEFKERHGHAAVPYNYQEDKRLSLWVTTQRREYHQKTWYGDSRKMRDERKKRLDEIGFIWDNSARKATPSLEYNNEKSAEESVVAKEQEEESDGLSTYQPANVTAFAAI